MIALIDVVNVPEQVEISAQNTPIQEIEVSVLNAPKQTIDITNQSIPGKKIEIFSPGCQTLDISTICPFRNDLQIEIDSKVPKALSILPQATNEQLRERKTSRIYIDINGEASFATLEQIKDLNTKTILVDALSDNKIGELSNEDIILLRM